MGSIWYQSNQKVKHNYWKFFGHLQKLRHRWTVKIVSCTVILQFIYLMKCLHMKEKNWLFLSLQNLIVLTSVHKSTMNIISTIHINFLIATMRCLIVRDFHGFLFQIHYMKPKNISGFCNHILKCSFTSFGLWQSNNNRVKWCFIKHLYKLLKGLIGLNFGTSMVTTLLLSMLLLDPRVKSLSHVPTQHSACWNSVLLRRDTKLQHSSKHQQSRMVKVGMVLMSRRWIYTQFFCMFITKLLEPPSKLLTFSRVGMWWFISLNP